MSWSDDCPARGAGLGHAHWDKCDPRRGHPGTGTVHLASECCHCALRPQDFTHGEPGAQDCTYPDCRVQGHKRQIPAPDDQAAIDRRLRDHVMREAGLPPEFLVETHGGPPEKRASLGTWDGDWPTSTRTAPPDGPAYGAGRSWRGDGALNPRDPARLVYFCTVVRDGAS